MGLGATVIVFNPATTIKSSDVNSNLANLNGAANPSFAVVTAQAPVKLATGFQETGRCGLYNPVAINGNLQAYDQNFKTDMTNVPTSLTLSATQGSSNATAAANHIDLLGFTFTATWSATGLCYWLGQYTTVGNCLLALDAQAATFDHHCDGCGRVHVNVAAHACRVQTAPGLGASLAYDCPDCGVIESFCTDLTALDEQDESPQGADVYLTTRGAQATLIRQLMTLVGLPVR